SAMLPRGAGGCYSAVTLDYLKLSGEPPGFEITAHLIQVGSQSWANKSVNDSGTGALILPDLRGYFRGGRNKQVGVGAANDLCRSPLIRGVLEPEKEADGDSFHLMFFDQRSKFSLELRLVEDLVDRPIPKRP